MRPAFAAAAALVVAGTAATAAAQSGSPCDAARMTLVRDYVGSRGTGVSQAMLQLRNDGAASCVLGRRPRLTLLDGSGAIPFVFTYVRQCVLSCGRTRTVTPARPVIVRPGRSVYVSFDSYRCDLGTRRVATAVRIVVASHSLVVRLPATRPSIAWCGRGDPGSYLNVSPYEPTPQLAAQRA